MLQPANDRDRRPQGTIQPTRVDGAGAASQGICSFLCETTAQLTVRTRSREVARTVCLVKFSPVTKVAAVGRLAF